MTILTIVLRVYYVVEKREGRSEKGEKKSSEDFGNVVNSTPDNNIVLTSPFPLLPSHRSDINVTVLVTPGVF